MEIFFTDSVSLADPVPGMVEDELARQRAGVFAGRFVPEQMPFVLNGNGSYHSALNSFFRSLPTSAVRFAAKLAGLCARSGDVGPVP
ncbi:hypothetical protein BTZ20_0324 [Rhodococcus sp. MTM3W5.2]|uniref:hypothetical protein n=1 Tax=Rhodococcus sp. MTM3W5.2 TaxID=1805827 RepID=UPI00097978B1|nr:hypothetical protein [Rhodococcus sp. MTM3W5.2]AQA25055.1 hypothetical protein BTZ20_0324 [Rhodococcus sp. MTM3W5.2]